MKNWFLALYVKLWLERNVHLICEQITKAVICRCFSKYVFLKISEYSQENTCIIESLFNKAAGMKACYVNKKRLEHRCFPVNIPKFLRMPCSGGCVKHY